MSQHDDDGDRFAAEAFGTELGRRGFISGLGKLSAAVSAALGTTLAPAVLDLNVAQAAELGPLNARERRARAFLVRLQAALIQLQQPLVEHRTNGDEQRFKSRIGNYSKGLPHRANGEVDPNAYRALLAALDSGDPADFEAIPLGGVRRLVNPQGGLAFDLEGVDSHQTFMPPAPAFSSAEEAGEMVELYWMSLLRDVPFTDYAEHPLALAAVADLNSLSDFRGPRLGGLVTPQTLFRDDLPGALEGPYISQFLLLTAPFGSEFIDRLAVVTVPNLDYMTAFPEWLALQNGALPTRPIVFDPVRRYVRDGRALGQWVHVDVLYQGFLEACLVAVTQAQNTASPPNSGPFGLGVPPNPSNPYIGSRTQDPFVTFGAPMNKTLVAEITTRALKAVWFHKWFVHRRLRPEEFGGRVERTLRNAAGYPIHPDLLDSPVLGEIFARFGSFLLPQAYPEGSPLHPAYGSGHAVVAGAGVTILKAVFNESFVIPAPVVPAPDGLSLVPFSGPPLTVGGELNKLASNISTGRNIAGIHWRTDAIEGIRLGEQVAISILRELRLTFNEPFDGFTFTNFDGEPITV
jgi:hypothetical protein